MFGYVGGIFRHEYVGDYTHLAVHRAVFHHGLEHRLASCGYAVAEEVLLVAFACDCLVVIAVEIAPYVWFLDAASRGRYYPAIGDAQLGAVWQPYNLLCECLAVASASYDHATVVVLHGACHHFARRRAVFVDYDVDAAVFEQSCMVGKFRLGFVVGGVCGEYCAVFRDDVVADLHAWLERAARIVAQVDDDVAELLVAHRRESFVKFVAGVFVERAYLDVGGAVVWRVLRVDGSTGQFALGYYVFFCAFSTYYADY